MGADNGMRLRFCSEAAVLSSFCLSRVCFVGSFEADGRAEGQAEPPDAERCPEGFETLWLSGQISGLSCDQ